MVNVEENDIDVKLMVEGHMFQGRGQRGKFFLLLDKLLSLCFDFYPIPIWGCLNGEFFQDMNNEKKSSCATNQS